MPPLPDEIISEILSPALKIPDELFADNWSKVSPFATYSESTSAYLVVCKSWLRVATPLLYHVVALRSSAQASALAHSLKGNPELGRFIKKLRVEGGLGSAMHTVLQLSPNITDLFLSLDIFATDKTDGLCKGLPLINPHRFISQCPEERRRNKQLSALVDSLVQIFPKWDRLVALGLPFKRVAFQASQIDSPWSETLVQSLNPLKRIKTVAIASYTAAKVQRIFNWLSECSLDELYVMQPMGVDEIEQALRTEKLRRIIKYTAASPKEDTEIVPSLNPFFTPLANISDGTSDHIWSRILYFAMSIPERVESGETMWISGRRGSNMSFLCVSKRFHRVGLPHFYTCVNFRRAKDPIRLANILTAQPSLSARVQTIRGKIFYEDAQEEQAPSAMLLGIMDFPSRTPAPPPPSREDIFAALSTVFSKLTNLVVVELIPVEFASFLWSYQHEIHLGPDVFASIAESSGSTLTSLSVPVGHVLGLPNTMLISHALECLTALRKLRWKSPMTLNCINVPGGLLPQLVHLEVHEVSESFYRFLNAANPPLLRHVTLLDQNLAPPGTADFLTQQKITHLDISLKAVRDLSHCVLDMCPTLVSLRLDWSLEAGLASGIPQKNILNPQSHHASVEKIYLRCGTFLFHPNIDKNQKTAAKWADYLISLPFGRMPKLKEIRIDGVEWPVTQRDITKSPWVRAAEALQEVDVSLVNSSGQKWRSRLKLRR